MVQSHHRAGTWVICTLPLIGHMNVSLAKPVSHFGIIYYPALLCRAMRDQMFQFLRDIMLTTPSEIEMIHI